MITDESTIIRHCHEELSNVHNRKSHCRDIAVKYMMKEIMLLLQLKHPSILSLLGFCVRGEYINSMSLQEHGVIAVYEYGDRVNITDMELWPMSRRLDTAIQLLDLAIYAEHSPLGSLKLGDMRHTNFVIVGSRIKFSDVDYVSAQELRCSAMKPGSECRFHLRCVENHCRGFNAKINLMRINQLFFATLLRQTRLKEETIPANIIKAVNNRLRSMLSELNILNITTSLNSTDVYRKLINVRNML